MVLHRPSEPATGYRTSAQNHLFVGSDIRKSRPYRISYLQLTARTRFWATAEQAHKKGFQGDAGDAFISLKLKEHNFRARSQPQRRSPGSSAAAGIDEHLSNPAKTVHELAVNSPRDPRPGIELPDVRVPRNL
jgi:hypothetical protein